MNNISSRTETKSHTIFEESDDGHRNIVQTEKTVTETFLYITVSHKTVDEMAARYTFNQEQKDYLAEPLKDGNIQLWSRVRYGIGYSDDQIVTVTLSQAGNVGGQPYWSCKDRGQWADRNYEPSPGTIIFFGWEGDGETDHTGIVQKYENGTVYTVKSNTGDSCRTRTYSVGSSVIYGYSISAY